LRHADEIEERHAATDGKRDVHALAAGGRWARVAARLEHAARLFVRIRVAELRDAEGVREVVRAAIEVGIEMDRARSLVDIVAAVLAPEDAQPRREQRLRDEIEVDA